MVGNIPNLLTLTRILLLPFFAATLVYEKYGYALIIFVSAAMTDLFDGYIARVKNQTTYLGSILDPVADKFFLITSFIIMSYAGLIPKWLAITVISRDLIVVTGSIILYFVIHNLKIETSIIGKIASASQFLLVGFVLLSLNINEEMHAPMLFLVIIAVVTAVSGLHYVIKGLKMANPENTN